MPAVVLSIKMRTLQLVLLTVSLVASLSAQTTGRLSIDKHPAVELGGSLDDPSDQFGLVVGATRLPDGRLLVMDLLPPSVRLYDENGRHIRDIGRRGNGPGEFQQPLDFVVSGDTLAVLDQRGRIAWFNMDGDVLRTDRISAESLCGDGFLPRLAGLLADASVVLRCEERLFGRVRGEYRQEVGLLRIRMPSSVDTLGFFPADSGRTDRGSVPIPRPYLPNSPVLWAANHGNVFVAASSQPTVRILPVSHASASEHALPLRPRRVTDQDVEEAIETGLRVVGNENDRRVIGEWLREMPTAETTPFIRSLVATTDGEIWIESWDRSASGSVWLVFDPTGSRVTRAEAPIRAELLAAGRDWTLWLSKDEFGADRVRLHRVDRETR